MTREEAYNELKKQMKVKGEYHHIYAYVEFDQVNDLIEKIYEDFENRICRNCRWYLKYTDGCKNPQNTAMNGGIYMLVTEDFGCNRFERKESE